MSAILTAVITRMFSQRVLIAILLKLGDWIVARSETI